MRIHVHGSGHLARITNIFIQFQGHDSVLLESAELVWCCEDIDGSDGIEAEIQVIVDLAKQNLAALFLVSSQLPVGSIKHMEGLSPATHFACCPENFKTLDGPDAYLKQARFVLGVRDLARDSATLTDLLGFQTIIWMTVESAEMVKHAINAYLGMCISFINEIGDICKVTGADIKEVEQGLLTDPRVSPLAPLHAGGPFGLGHIDRDLNYLSIVKPESLIQAIQVSNNARKTQ